jgi:hypothetical protein
VLKPCLSIVKQDHPKYDYDLYIATWAALRTKGIHGRRFEVAVKKLLVTDEAKKSHEGMINGVKSLEQASLIGESLSS